MLIHDGVRPLINEKVITDNIESVKKNGSAITTAVVKETILVVNEKTSTIDYVPSRNNSRVARAPQSFWLNDILEAHEKSLSEGETNCIDSCTMMQKYGHNLFLVDGPGENIKITVGPKGFGSENMSAIRMFKPSHGLQGIKDFIIETVETAGPNPCPPMVVGVGIGGTFDKAALLAKKALMRPIDSSNPDPFYADLEKEMLEKINELGIGPQGFGGKTTAIGLNIETLPTHIAGMPCAININCHVTRHKTEVI